MVVFEPSWWEVCCIANQVYYWSILLSSWLVYPWFLPSWCLEEQLHLYWLPASFFTISVKPLQFFCGPSGSLSTDQLRRTNIWFQTKLKPPTLNLNLGGIFQKFGGFKRQRYWFGFDWKRERERECVCVCVCVCACEGDVCERVRVRV